MRFDQFIKLFIGKYDIVDIIDRLLLFLQFKLFISLKSECRKGGGVREIN